MKKMYLGNIYSADLEDNHITVEVDGELEVYGGRVALLPYKDYENLVNGVVSEEEKALHKQNVNVRYLNKAKELCESVIALTRDRRKFKHLISVREIGNEKRAKRLLELINAR